MVDIRPFRPEDASLWDDFVQKSRNGTFFHSRKFLTYHPVDKFQDASLIFSDESKILATLSAALVEEKGKNFLVSHPGASYGGLALSSSCGMKETGEVIDALLTHAKEQGYAGVRFLRLTPPSVRRAFSDDQEYWLFQHGWHPFRIELATSLSLLGVDPDKVLDSFTGKCRNMVRQGERMGLSVRETGYFDQFWPILEKMLSERHHSKPTHTLAEIKRLHDLCPSDVRLFGAYSGTSVSTDRVSGGEMVAGVVGIVLHPEAIYTLYMAQDYAYQAQHPLHCIVAELASLCIREGRKILHFGISTEEGGTQVNEGLFFFKESFGGQSVRRESWELRLN